MSAKRGKKPMVPGLEAHGGGWRWRKMIGGRRMTFPLKALTQEEAVAEVLVLRGQPQLFDVGAWAAEVDGYLTEKLRMRKMQARTAEVRRETLMLLKRKLGVETPRAVTPKMLGTWLAEEEQLHPTSSTPATYRAHVRSFFKFLFEAGRLPFDPAAELLLPRVEDVVREIFLPSEEVLPLLDAARREGDQNMEWILALGFECGFRRMEICAVRKEWFNLRVGVVEIPKEDGRFKRKGREGERKTAVIPLSKVMLELISRHGLPEPFLVHPEKEWEVWRYRCEFRGKLKRFFVKHGHPELTIHDMRRSFASNRVSNGVSIEKVARWMGINVKTAWARYARFIPADEQINQGAALRAVAEEVPVLVPAAVEMRKSAIERLEELAELKDKGLISVEEWAVARGRVLAGI